MCVCLISGNFFSSFKLTKPNDSCLISSEENTHFIFEETSSKVGNSFRKKISGANISFLVAKIDLNLDSILLMTQGIVLFH